MAQTEVSNSRKALDELGAIFELLARSLARHGDPDVLEARHRVTRVQQILIGALVAPAASSSGTVRR